MKHICHEPTVGTLNRRCSWARSLPRGMRRALRARSLRLAGIMEANEQVIFPPLPRHHYPAAAHPLPDLPPHRGVPARQPQLGPDRALPPGPSRSAQPSFPVASAGSPLPRRYSHRHRLPPDDLARAGRVSASAVTECGHPREHGRFKIVKGPCRPCQAAASRGVKATQVRPESVVRYMAGGDDPFASAPGAQANPVRALMKSKLVPSWVKERPCGTAVQVRPPFAVV